MPPEDTRRDFPKSGKPTERHGALYHLKFGFLLLFSVDERLELGNRANSKEISDVTVLNGKRGLALEGSPQFPNGFSGKLLFHLTFNRNFRIFWLNGKHSCMPPDDTWRDFPKSGNQPNDMALYTIWSSVSCCCFPLMRDWNWEIVQIVRKFPTFRSERKKRTSSEGSPQFQNGFSGKLLFHLTFNRNLRIFWLNGKHPMAPEDTWRYRIKNIFYRMKIFLSNEKIFYQLKIYFIEWKYILSNENISVSNFAIFRQP